MTVTTYRIMRNNYIRLKIADYFYKTFGNFVYRSCGQCLRVLVVISARHARITVSKVHNTG